MLRVRWVTWCPSPYFVKRYAALSARPDVDFEAVFMAARSSHQAWTLDQRRWSFPFRVVSPGATSVGYYRGARSLRMARPALQGGGGMVVVLPYADLGAVVATTVARLAGRRVYLFVASTEADDRSGGAVAEFMKHYMFRAASGILATGPLQERYARRYAGAQKHVHMIGNPVDTELLREQVGRLATDRAGIRRSRGWESSLVVAYVGRLAPEKGLDVLLRAARRAGEGGIPVVVAMAGGGPMEGWLRDRAASEGVRLDMVGFVEGAELGQLYVAADVFVLPSQSEPWGLVVNEAMEFGLPVVVSDRVGSRHLLADGESGFVVPYGDVAKLADVLERLATDEGLRSQVGAAGKARISGETIARWVDAVVDALT